MSGEPEPGWMTIEELSRRSGVTTRNIRAYQSRGLLSPPVVRPGSRAAKYSTDHLTRLRLVSRLQDRGFSLAGIGDLLEAWAEGKTVEQVLGIESALADSEEEPPPVVGEQEIRAFLPEGVDPEQALRRLSATGLVVRGEQGYRVQHPTVMQLGLDAVAAGIPFETIPDEFVRLQEDLHRIAERFVGLYVTHVIEPFLAAGMPAERLPAVLDGIKRLRKLAAEALLPLMRRAIADEIDAAVRVHLPAPDEPFER
jgi:DNA-binding transcriptional MerR regulator